MIHLFLKPTGRGSITNPQSWRQFLRRSLVMINGTTPPAAKKLIKDEPEWGEAPKGTRAQLLGDIAGILDEAITNIDDVSRRDEKSPLLSRSLRKLTAASSRY